MCGFHTRLHSLAHGLGNIVWVFIAYPATLKFSDSKGKVITVRNEELKKMESEMEK